MPTRETSDVTTPVTGISGVIMWVWGLVAGSDRRGRWPGGGVALWGSAGIGRQQPGLAERGPGSLGVPLPRDQVIVGRGQRTQ